MRYTRKDGTTLDVDGEPPFTGKERTVITSPSGQTTEVLFGTYAAMVNGYLEDLSPEQTATPSSS